jgi:hypothetical protein
MLASGLVTTAAASPLMTHSPAQHVTFLKEAAGWTAPNWSGYAGTLTGATEVEGNWTVPSVRKTKGNTYSSSWIGIDGFTNDDLIQTGTEQDWVNGHAVYDAWWEILPASETVITHMTVHPGDSMTADIFFAGAGDWWISIEDVTESEPFSILQPYSGPADSVEWIQEATTINGKIATEAHYSLYDWTECGFNTGTSNNPAGNPIAFQPGNRGVMVQKNKDVSTPSLAQENDTFAVEYGAKTPPPPA